jgi:uncharacterized protein YoaH (UPF0181 family)
MDDDLANMTSAEMQAEIVRLRDMRAAGVDDGTYRAILALGAMLHEPHSKEQRRRAIELYYVVMDKITRR